MTTADILAVKVRQDLVQVRSRLVYRLTLVILADIILSCGLYFEDIRCQVVVVAVSALRLLSDTQKPYEFVSR